MVESQIEARGIRDSRLLEVMRRLPRERFLPAELARQAYDDRALPVGLDQTISQPYIVALMTSLLQTEPHHRVLEIGTGTGYQTAVLASLVKRVYSIERLESLSRTARQRLATFGLHDITYRVGDGSLGWPEEAPFDRILVTAAAPRVIPTLVDQLIEGGILVLPVEAGGHQRLTTVERRPKKVIEHPSIAVRFVRLIGEEAFDA